MFNTKLLTYDITIPQHVRNKLRKFRYKDNVVLGVIVTNLLAGIRHKNAIVYSRDKSADSITSKRKISVRKIIKAVDFLEQQGYITNLIGKGSSIPENRTISTILPTEKFMNEFPDLSEIEMDEVERAYLTAIESLILRNKDKKAIPYEHTDETEKMKELVVKLNILNEKATILTGTGERLSNVYSRIFNESFDQGGRFYRADILQLHSKDGDQRLDITIDGKPVVEVDFQNLHFRIAAAVVGVPMQDVPMDMYADILEDVTNKVDRRIVKLAVNIMFNCDRSDTAKRAIQSEINTLSEEDKAVYTLGNARSVMALILQSYPDFEGLFFAMEPFGRVLQNIDSHLAADILEVFVLKEIPILCVHDSFVVAKEHLELLVLTMADKFRERFKIDCPVPMSIKWKDTSKTGTTRKDTNKSVLEKKIVL